MVGESRDRWKSLCHPARGRAVLSVLPVASHPNLLQLFQMLAVPQTRCQVGEALCADTAGGQPVGDKERQISQSPGLPRSATDDRGWKWLLGTVGRGHLSSINLSALD